MFFPKKLFFLLAGFSSLGAHDLSDQLCSLLFTPTQHTQEPEQKKEEIISKRIYKSDFSCLGVEYLDHIEYYQTSKKFPVVQEIDLGVGERKNFQVYRACVEQRKEIPWYIEFVSDAVGYGAFADDDIKMGEYIGEYTGLILDEESLKTLEAFDKRYAWTIYPPQWAGITQRFSVDAKKFCNFTRFINHSYKPNVVAVTLYCADGWHMTYIALKPIKKGEQLLVDYGKGYWYDRQPVDL